MKSFQKYLKRYDLIDKDHIAFMFNGWQFPALSIHPIDTKICMISECSSARNSNDSLVEHSFPATPGLSIKSLKQIKTAKNSFAGCSSYLSIFGKAKNDGFQVLTCRPGSKTDHIKFSVSSLFMQTASIDSNRNILGDFKIKSIKHRIIC